MEVSLRDGFCFQEHSLPFCPPEEGQILFQREGPVCAVGKVEEPHGLSSTSLELLLSVHFISFLGRGSRRVRLPYKYSKFLFS